MQTHVTSNSAVKFISLLSYYQVDGSLGHKTYKVVVLASGGIDSTALIDFYLRKGMYVEGIHFQYGQNNGESELKSFEKIKTFYQIEGKVIKLDFSLPKKQDEIMGRNAIFLFAAGFSTEAKKIALGIHADTPYYDCSRTFLHDTQKILDGYFAGTVQIDAPFIELNKKDILAYCADFKVPIELTYSCQRQNNWPCGVCPTCRELTLLGR
jgi:7-cyano-7-deazaguanine synthase